MRRGLRPDNVEHWAAKKIAMMGLWDLATQAEIADHVFSDNPRMAERVQNNLDHWETKYPARKDGPGKPFFTELCLKIGRADLNSNAMTLSKLDEFIGFLSDKADQAKCWRKLKHALDNSTVEFSKVVTDIIIAHRCEVIDAEHLVESAPVAQPQGLRSSFAELKLKHQWQFQSIREAADSGRLDTRHYYMTPDADAGWQALIQAKAYPTYEHCRAGLKKLVASASWEATIAKQKPCTVVMLAGGGAPTKDLVLIRALLKSPHLQERKLYYHLVDISPFMLWSTYCSLINSPSSPVGGDGVQVKLWVDDVLELHELTTKHFRTEGAVLFGITGGTIGNLQESAFFDALGGVSEKEDLLIVSADTIPGKSNPKERGVERTIVHRYDHAALRRFMAPAVRNLAAELGPSRSAQSLFKGVSVGLDRRGAYSDVPNGVSLTMHLKSRMRSKQPVNILVSTRYHGPTLVTFAARWGWEKVAEVRSPRNRNYVQFLFKKVR